MKYCSKCTYPIVAVNLTMSDENVCSGCITHDEKIAIDWDSREDEFKELLFQYKSKNNENYDCIIPVSGGKDSQFRDPRVWWIEDGLWWKDTLWGGVTSYGKSFLSIDEQLKYKR